MHDKLRVPLRPTVAWTWVSRGTFWPLSAAPPQRAGVFLAGQQGLCHHEAAHQGGLCVADTVLRLCKLNRSLRNRRDLAQTCRSTFVRSVWKYLSCVFCVPGEVLTRSADTVRSCYLKELPHGAKKACGGRKGRTKEAVNLKLGVPHRPELRPAK